MMTTKRFFLALGLAASSAAALASPDVGVSVQIGQPGLYGRVDIGRVATPPVLVYPQPMVVVPGPVMQREPIYLHVPPGHARHWRRHCRRYNACGQPVYFVRDDWYQRHYYQPQRHVMVPPREDWRDRHGMHPRHDRHDDRHGERHGHGRGHGHDHDHDHDHGRGHGR